MLDIISKLVYLLTISPFGDQSGLWKNSRVGLGYKNKNDELPNSGSSSSEDHHDLNMLAGSASTSLKELQEHHSSWRHLELVRKARSTHQPLNFKVGRDWLEKRTAAQDLTGSFFGALISTIVLMYSENQTIIFLLGYALVLHTVAAFVSIGELILGKDGTLKYINVSDINDFGSMLLGTAVVAKIYYFIYPPELQLPIATATTTSPPVKQGVVKFPAIK